MLLQRIETEWRGNNAHVRKVEMKKRWCLPEGRAEWISGLECTDEEHVFTKNNDQALFLYNALFAVFSPPLFLK